LDHPVADLDGGDATMGEHVDVVHTVGVEGGGRTPAGRPEANDGSNCQDLWMK
jgi:hypothetical protein